jgi:signal transduction histidine kinase/ActR/RegA family two-component response regulator
MLEIFGFAPDKTFAGLHQFCDAFPIYPEDRPSWDAAIAAHMASTRVRFEAEMRARIQGQPRWIKVTGLVSRGADNAPLRWTGSATDITEFKHAERALSLSEERYALALEASEEGHFDWNVATDEIFVSPKINMLLDLPPATRHGSRTEFLENVPYHPEDRVWLADGLTEVLAGRVIRHEFEYRILGKGSKVRWLRACWLIRRNESGAAMRVVGVLREITERKRADDELKAMERQLRQSQRLETVGTLAGGIAHDFNNILGAILGFSEMALRYTPPGSTLHRDVESIAKAGERGRALVERILVFSRSGMGKIVSVHVEEIVREALDIASANSPESIRITARLKAGRAAMLGDPTQVHQVVTNLVSNAIQAMPYGGVLHVSLKALVHEGTMLTTSGRIGAGPYVMLKVSDRGIGMSADTMDRIFDPFFTTKEVGGGTGLGLSLVHGIVKGLGGGIGVESTPGKGSTFTVYLPRVGDASDRSAERDGELPRGGGQRVLIVDDEEPLVRFTADTLRYLGYIPVPFTSGLSALKAFRADPHRFDALITDERMPGLSGTDLIREVRGIRRALPIVLASGYLEESEMALAHESGADHVLRKPLLAIDLSACLARALAPRSGT